MDRRRYRLIMGLPSLISTTILMNYYCMMVMTLKHLTLTVG